MSSNFIKRSVIVFGIANLFSVSVASQAQSLRLAEKTSKQSTSESAAVIPWHFSNGTPTARKAAKQFLSDLMMKLRISEVSGTEVRQTLVADISGENPSGGVKKANIPEGYTMLYADILKDEEEDDTLTTPAQMLRVGKKLNVDWVIAGSADWHSRSIWIALGPKTKSTCTISFRVVDVKNKEVVLDVQNMQMDSTAKEDTLSTFGSLFVSSFFTILSGGPKTPHEIKAVQLGIVKSLEPWIVRHQIITKIDSE